jgi:predicted enzyme related to lactoylglutathione lyase
VSDIEKAAAWLVDRGVTLERYPHLPQDAQGVWTAPDGVRIVWFKDPDGNVLGLVQFR